MSKSDMLLKVLKEVNTIIATDLDDFKEKAIEVVTAYAGPPPSLAEGRAFAEIVVESIKLVRRVLGFVDAPGVPK